jgi:hypothetical protein
VRVLVGLEQQYNSSRSSFFFLLPFLCILNKKSAMSAMNRFSFSTHIEK